MNYKEYITNVKKTESVLPQETLIDTGTLMQVMRLGIFAGQVVDMYKAQMFYNRPINKEKLKESLDSLSLATSRMHGLSIDSRNASVVSRDPWKPSEATHVSLRLLHSVFGLNSESAEIMENLLKAMQDKTEPDKVNLTGEYSDMSWFMGIGMDDMGTDAETVWDQNIAKLRVRFGEKFSLEAANNRNVDAENEAIVNAGKK